MIKFDNDLFQIFCTAYEQRSPVFIRAYPIASPTKQNGVVIVANDNGSASVTNVGCNYLAVGY